ncbi:UNVERIFIED_CONTAM: hypothetical protein K2H54_032609 [Gekko kuhli]
MKLRALALVLAIFTGSLASVRGDKRRPLFAQLLEDVEGYLDVVSSAAGEKVEWVAALNSTQELEKQFANDYRSVWGYMDQLFGKLPAGAQEMVVQIRDVTWFFLVNGIVQLGNRKDDVFPMLRETMAPFADPILEKMRGQAEALSAGIQKFSRKEKERLKLQLDDLKTYKADFDSFIHEVHSQWLKSQKSVAAWADWFQEYYTQGVETLKPYLASVLQAPEGPPKE